MKPDSKITPLNNSTLFIKCDHCHFFSSHLELDLFNEKNVQVGFGLPHLSLHYLWPGNAIYSLKHIIMKKNMGSTDRIIRTIIALVAIYLYYTGAVAATLGIVLIVVAAIFLLTSLVSFCPLYTLFGLKTCSTRES